MKKDPLEDPLFHSSISLVLPELVLNFLNPLKISTCTIESKDKAITIIHCPAEILVM